MSATANAAGVRPAATPSRCRSARSVKYVADSAQLVDHRVRHLGGGDRQLRQVHPERGLRPEDGVGAVLRRAERAELGRRRRVPHEHRPGQPLLLVEVVVGDRLGACGELARLRDRRLLAGGADVGVGPGDRVLPRHVRPHRVLAVAELLVVVGKGRRWSPRAIPTRWPAPARRGVPCVSRCLPGRAGPRRAGSATRPTRARRQEWAASTRPTGRAASRSPRHRPGRRSRRRRREAGLEEAESARCVRHHRQGLPTTNAMRTSDGRACTPKAANAATSAE